MPRKQFTVACVSCYTNFKTTSINFNSCSICRKANGDSKLIKDFIQSSFGKWITYRLSASGTFKVLGSIGSNTLPDLYNLYVARRNYCQFTYCANGNEWSRELDLQLCHLYPLNGIGDRVGELTPRNLTIAPATLNQSYKDKVFDCGYYVRSSDKLSPKQVRKLLSTRYKAFIIAFQKEHRLKPVIEAPTTTITPKKKYTLLDIAIMEATRNGIEALPNESAMSIFNRTLKGNPHMKTTQAKAPALYCKAACDEIRLWSTDDYPRNLSDELLSAYFILSTFPESKFKYITIRDKNLDVTKLLHAISSRILPEILVNTYLDIEIASEVNYFILNALTGGDPSKLTTQHVPDAGDFM